MGTISVTNKSLRLAAPTLELQSLHVCNSGWSVLTYTGCQVAMSTEDLVYENIQEKYKALPRS